MARASERLAFAAHRSNIREWYCPQAQPLPLNIPSASSVPPALRRVLTSSASVTRLPHTAR